ncbi:MAG: Gfo/Idh/MocA family oxidoreductase [Pseudomonadota bacterium]
MKRIALIGPGMAAGMHARAINESGEVQLAGIWGRTLVTAEAFGQAHAPEAAIYQTLEHLLGDDAIDAVLVATPPDARLDLVGQLAAAGKPILLEKPVERSFAQAQEVVALCKDVPLGVVLQHRVRPAAQQLRDVLQAGAIGEVGAVEISVPWWRGQDYYDAPGRGTYSRDGGGVLLTQAIHTLDLALYLLGPVIRVQAMAHTTRLHQMEAEDFVSAGLVFASGAAGALTASTASFPGRGEAIMIHGTLGSACLGTALEIYWQDGRTETFGAAVASGAGADPMAFGADWHRALIEDFLRSIDNGRPSIAPGADALAVQRLIDALLLSSKEGRAVQVEDVT